MEKSLKSIECKKINNRENSIIIQVIHDRKLYHALIDSGSGFSITSHYFPNISKIDKIIGRDIHNKETIFEQGYQNFWITIGQLQVKLEKLYYYPNIIYDFLIGQSFINRNLPFTIDINKVYFTSPCGTQFSEILIKQPYRHNYTRSQRGDKQPLYLNEEKTIFIKEKILKLLEQCYEEDPQAFKNRNKYFAEIELITEKPICEKPMIYTKEDEKDYVTIINKHLKYRLIRETKSAYNSASFLVRNHNELKRGEPRLVINYKPLNKIVKDYPYPLPRKDMIYEKIREGKIFSKFDLKSGFYQILLKENSKACTAFSTPQGRYEWNVLPMGLKTSPGIFQERLDKIYKDCYKFIIIYIDDILIFSQTIEDHNKHLFIFVTRAYENGLVLSKKKAEIAKEKISYLGLIIEKGVIELQSHISEKILEFPDQLENLKQVQSFLGHINYASQFIKDCAKLKSKLQAKIKKDKKFEWNEDDTKSVQDIKKKVQNLERLPLPKEEDELYIETDASDKFWGAVLRRQGDNLVLRYSSGTFRGAELNYDINEKEVLAVIRAIEVFKIWLARKEFIVKTDNTQVKAFLENKIKDNIVNRRRIRWQMKISPFTFKVIYIKGTNNCFADHLSRFHG